MAKQFFLQCFALNCTLTGSKHENSKRTQHEKLQFVIMFMVLFSSSAVTHIPIKYIKHDIWNYVAKKKIQL